MAHIFSSLLPAGNRILRRIGVWDKMDDTFIRKYGGEFVSSDGDSRVNNIFSRGLIKGMDYTYQVERAKLDQLLLDNAKGKGCTVLQPCKVTDSELIDGYWRVKLASRQQPEAFNSAMRARWLLDASGRTLFYGKAKRLSKDTMPYPKRLAVYSHFTGVKRQPCEQGGNTIITRLRDGWFWSIPLDQDKTSVKGRICLMLPIPQDGAATGQPARRVLSSKFSSRCVEGILFTSQPGIKVRGFIRRLLYPYYLNGLRDLDQLRLYEKCLHFENNME